MLLAGHAGGIHRGQAGPTGSAQSVLFLPVLCRHPNPIRMHGLAQPASTGTSATPHFGRQSWMNTRHGELCLHEPALGGSRKPRAQWLTADSIQPLSCCFWPAFLVASVHRRLWKVVCCGVEVAFAICGSAPTPAHGCVCRSTQTDAVQDARGASNLAGAASRTGLTTSMIHASSSLAASSMLGAGRPHTPTLSSLNLPRTATSTAVGLVPGNGGIAAQLSRVGSRAHLGAANTTGGLFGATPPCLPGERGRRHCNHKHHRVSSHRNSDLPGAGATRSACAGCLSACDCLPSAPFLGGWAHGLTGQLCMVHKAEHFTRRRWACVRMCGPICRQQHRSLPSSTCWGSPWHTWAA